MATFTLYPMCAASEPMHSAGNRRDWVCKEPGWMQATDDTPVLLHSALLFE